MAPPTIPSAREFQWIFHEWSLGRRKHPIGQAALHRPDGRVPCWTHHGTGGHQAQENTQNAQVQQRRRGLPAVIPVQPSPPFH